MWPRAWPFFPLAHTAFPASEFYFLPCLFDTLAYFTLGRLAYRRGVDNFAFIAPCITGACFMSWLGYIPALHVSFTADSIDSQWSNDTYVWVVVLAIVLFGFLSLSFYTAYKEGILITRAIEMGAVSALVLKPIMASPDFHPHHWFIAILLGIHINQRFWWSLTLQGFLWGVYINGIAVYGRDGLIGCDEVKYRSEDQFCPVVWYGYDDDR